MPEDFCQCGRELVGERTKRLDQCPSCEKFEKRKKLDDVSGFVAAQPILGYEDGLTYVIQTQPEFED